MDPAKWFENQRKFVIDHENAPPDHNEDGGCVSCWYPLTPSPVLDLWFAAIFPVVTKFIVSSSKSPDPNAQMIVMLPENITAFKNEWVREWLYDFTQKFVCRNDEELWNFDDWEYDCSMVPNKHAMYITKYPAQLSSNDD